MKINISLPKKIITGSLEYLTKHDIKFVLGLLVIISIVSFNHYYTNGLGLAYNDARSHLDIGRRVVEGLKPGIAQLGSVWLPLLHILMGFTIWNDFMWHSGLSGAIISMISFVVTGVLIYKYLKELEVGLLGRFAGIIVFVANINILYLQSTAMTELLLLATMTLATFELLKWFKNDNILHLIKAAFWIMLSTVTRYDGWFLLAWASLLVIIKIVSTKDINKHYSKNLVKKIYTYIQLNYKHTEGALILFLTLASFGIVLWLLWNLLIFKDALYFAYGPFSAKSQQDQLEKAGVLITKGNWFLSAKFYFYALIFNSGAYQAIVGTIGAFIFWFDKNIKNSVKLASTALFASLFFNVLALYLGHSVLFIQGLSGDTWFNVRYGIMMLPSFAIFIGYLVHKARYFRPVIIGLLGFVLFFQFTSSDAVTIDDARVGSSQKNVTEVSGWLKEHASKEKGFILISAASHDAIIFSSGMPMKRFIHEGTGLYWESATTLPDRWARWIIMRTYDDNDLTWKNVKETPGFERYRLVDHFPFADIYEIYPEYLDQLNYEPIIREQK